MRWKFVFTTDILWVFYVVVYSRSSLPLKGHESIGFWSFYSIFVSTNIQVHAVSESVLSLTQFAISIAAAIQECGCPILGRRTFLNLRGKIHTTKKLISSGAFRAKEFFGHLILQRSDRRIIPRFIYVGTNYYFRFYPAMQ